MLIPSSQFVFSLRFTFLQPGNTLSLPEKERVKYRYKVQSQFQKNEEQSRALRTHTGSCRPLKLITVTDHYIHYIPPPPHFTLQRVTYSRYIHYIPPRTLHYSTSHIHRPLRAAYNLHYIIHSSTA